MDHQYGLEGRGLTTKCNSATNSFFLQRDNPAIKTQGGVAHKAYAGAASGPNSALPMGSIGLNESRLQKSQTQNNAVTGSGPNSHSTTPNQTGIIFENA